MAQFITEETEDKYAAIAELQNAHMDAVITVGAEAGNVINVSIQLKADKNRINLAARRVLDIYLADAATGAAIIATAPSSGIAIGTSGAVLASVVANKYLKVVSTAAGLIDFNITEAGAKTLYLVVVMPNGRQVVSGAITFV